MESKIKCLVVDDEKFARLGIIEYIEEVDFLTLSDEAENPIEASQIIKENKIDLMFLDINMPKMSGIDFLKVSNNMPLTIITTAYNQYAVEGYELDVVDYLLKPIPFDRFLKACNKAVDFLSSKNKIDRAHEDYFFVKCNGIYERVVVNEIIAIEALQNYIMIYTYKKKITAYLTLKFILDYLPEKDFIKVHKSFIVAKKDIQAITQDTVVINDKSFPVGNTFEMFFMKLF